MPSRRQDSNIEDLAAIAQLYQSLNGGQQRAQDSHQQNALGILGLMMQQQGQEDNLDFKKSAAEQENNRFLASQTQASADMGLKLQMEQQRAQQEEAAQKGAMSRSALSGLAGMPGMTPDLYMQSASDLGVPGADAMVTRGKQAVTNNSVNRLQAMLGPIYGQFAKDPVNGQKALDMIWQSDPGMKSPDVQAGLQDYLQSQNEGLARPAPTPAHSPSFLPPIFSNGPHPTAPSQAAPPPSAPKSGPDPRTSAELLKHLFSPSPYVPPGSPEYQDDPTLPPYLNNQRRSEFQHQQDPGALLELLRRIPNLVF